MPASHAKDITKLAFSTNRLTFSRPTHRNFHYSPRPSATPLPIGVVGPPPSPPLPAASQYGDRVERKRKQAEMLKQGRELRASHNPKGKQYSVKKRFWKDVHVKETPGPSGHLSLCLSLPLPSHLNQSTRHNIQLTPRPTQPATKST